jgi:hypothetical protein
LARVIRELMWLIAAVGGALGWFLSITWDQGPSLEELIRDLPLLAIKLYAAIVVARIGWWALRLVARAVTK